MWSTACTAMPTVIADSVFARHSWNCHVGMGSGEAPATLYKAAPVVQEVAEQPLPHCCSGQQMLQGRP